MNLFGLLPFAATATGNCRVTAALALFTFFITQYAGIRAAGLGGYLEAPHRRRASLALWLIMIPVEILGLFTKPFALTIRLFANMVAGHIVIFFLLGLIFAMLGLGGVRSRCRWRSAIYLLELFVAFVQAYIFTMLSALFIGAGPGAPRPRRRSTASTATPPGEAHQSRLTLHTWPGRSPGHG